jgi:3-oxoadipate enol-lactonase
VPFAENQGARIYWDEQGQGAPVLLIMGLGWTSAMWHRTRPILVDHRTVALDNRGVGRSDVPPGPYSIALMASDAAAVLDAVGIERAHIFGVSMGGMIAEEFALQYPERVDSLILGCTAAGGPHAVPADSEVLQALFRRGLSPDEFAESMNAFIYHSSTPRERIEEDMALRRRWYPTAPALRPSWLGSWVGRYIVACRRLLPAPWWSTAIPIASFPRQTVT